MKKKVAVITRTKNRGLLLRRALISVSSQIFQNYTHIVVNDGGVLSEVHQALECLSDQQKSKVVVISNDKSMGMESASNIGIRSSDSDYIVIHDDDDSWQEEFLGTTVDYLENNKDAMGVVTQCFAVQEIVSSEKVKVLNCRIYKNDISYISLFSMCGENQFPPICFLIRRKIFEEIGMYDESFPVFGDWDFNLRFLRKHDIGFIKKPLANYHHRINKTAWFNNSIFSEEIRFYRNKLDNKFLRNDINSGVFGIGLSAIISKTLDSGFNIRKTKEKLRLFMYRNHITIKFRSYFPDSHAKYLIHRFHTK